MSDRAMTMAEAKAPYRALDGQLYHCACLRCYGSGAWCPVKKRNEDARTIELRAAAALPRDTKEKEA